MVVIPFRFTQSVCHSFYLAAVAVKDLDTVPSSSGRITELVVHTPHAHQIAVELKLDRA